MKMCSLFLVFLFFFQTEGRRIDVSLKYVENNYEKPYTCLDLFNNGETEDKVYTIYYDGKTPMDVVCDMTNGGWTVIAQRELSAAHPANCSQLFNSGWELYKQGFGKVSPNSNFWIGLQKMHLMTKRSEFNLRIDVSKGSTLNDYFIVYDKFVISPEDSLFKLGIGKKLYGTLPDKFSGHDDYVFSTFDKDNDSWEKNCAEHYVGGWWLGKCYNACLTCQSTHTGNWYFDSNASFAFFPNFQMKIKPIND